LGNRLLRAITKKDFTAVTSFESKLRGLHTKVEDQRKEATVNFDHHNSKVPDAPPRVAWHCLVNPTERKVSNFR
jgi:hypothetical protein